MFRHISRPSCLVSNVGYMTARFSIFVANGCWISVSFGDAVYENKFLMLVSI